MRRSRVDPAALVFLGCSLLSTLSVAVLAFVVFVSPAGNSDVAGLIVGGILSALFGSGLGIYARPNFRRHRVVWALLMVPHGLILSMIPLSCLTKPLGT